MGLVALILKYALLVGVLAYVVSVLRAMIVTMPTADGARPRKPAPAQPPAAKPKPQPQPAAVQPPPAVLEPPAEPVDAQPEPIPAAIPEPGPRPVAAPLPFPVEVEDTSSAPVLVVDEPGDSHLVAGAAVHLGHGLHIGRAPENDLVLDSPAISRQHAYIGPRADAWLLVDKGSANGTFVNGRRVTGPQELHDGDVVTLGDLVFVLSLSGGGRSG